ncbi:response regulator [Desertivirga brevis]|uniref:response regulator n=1 Tax=Desertivirga brevis TaxID=2810310 RepID=UPI001A96F2AD|nr:response regulator [Pedobacter sp. SYSU D00873]
MEKYKFIIIDDSALDCYIAEKMIRYTGKCEDVHCFLGATEALEFIKTSAVSADDPLTIIILDVLMPIMSGFVFVEEFEKLPENIKDRYRIIALTSSMNKNDIDKICSYDTVNDIMDKPITAETLSPLLF